MGKDPSFPFYASDWLGSTKRAMMTPEERSAYVDLLCHQWGEPTCSLPNNARALGALSGLGEGYFKGPSCLLRLCFPAHPTLDGRVANPRMLEIHADREEHRRKSSLGGKKSQEVQRIKRNQTRCCATDDHIKTPSRLLQPEGQAKGQPNSNLPPPPPSRKKKTTSSRRAYKSTLQDIELARYIWDKVQVVAPQQEAPNLEAWANDIRLMRERDKRTHEQIRALFNWANADDFWAANILCPAKLRKQWGQLDAKRRKQSEQPAREKPLAPLPILPILRTGEQPGDA